MLLVTTRQTKRWIIPKGWPIKGLRPAKSAAREAFEEAGVRGKVSAKSVGLFTYDKVLDNDGILAALELCLNLGDGVNQAANLASSTTSIPSRNLAPLTAFGNWF
jgi:ADP-ribose pyrophosphatase YjhB (NUDIX family)